MNDIQAFRIFNKLKSVYRISAVDTRKESTAEHCWSAIMLADFFLLQMNPVRNEISNGVKQSIDRLRVYELLMYHDLVEIEAGDSPMHPNNNFPDKREREERAFHVLQTKIPERMREKYAALFDEYENQGTVEARFAKAIDYLDAQIHELDYKEDWKGWTKEFLVSKRQKYFAEFPELDAAFQKIAVFLEQEGYFDQ